MNPAATPMPEAGDPAIAHTRWRMPLVWLVPVVAALIGVSMLLHAWLAVGPEITITFQTAAGLEAGKTPVKYKDVTVGKVTKVALSEDSSHVVVTVALDKNAASLTRKDTRFWVVRPRIGAGGVSGVDTLFSGAYIAVDSGTQKATSKSFSGLETPPTVIAGMPGRSFILYTDDLGSLDIGSPIYYRHIRVGRVASYQLNSSGRGVNVRIFIDAPYDRFVTTDTRFWNASGVNVTLGADGFKINTQSVATIIAGGIAFAPPLNDRGLVAHEHTEFVLDKDQETAMAPPDGPGQYFQLRFNQSLRGLSIGAPVQFSDINLGRVVSISLDYEADKKRFPTVVGIMVYPQRLGTVLKKLHTQGGDNEQQAAQAMRNMVDHGLRAQARPGNLLTGQLYIALDFIPDAPKASFDVNARPLTLPTVNSSIEQVQEDLVSIVSKINKIPFDTIGKNLNKTLQQMNGQVLPQTTRTLQQAQQTLGSAQTMLGEDAPLQQNLNQTLLEVQRASRSVRTLTDLLGRHPEALLQGTPAADAPEKPQKTTTPEEPKQ